MINIRELNVNSIKVLTNISANLGVVVRVRVLVLASSVLLMLPGAWGHSVTVVEFAHLPAGLSAWQYHELGMFRVCGPASKWLYSLPAYLAGIRVEEPGVSRGGEERRREWDQGRLFQARYRSNYHAIYRWSRLVPILVTVLGGMIICEWTTRLFGKWPGIASLCVWCWLPPVLAHGALVTSDMPAAVVALMAARCFWAFLVAPGLRTAGLAGLTLGLAASTKFTLLALYPCWGFLLLGRVIRAGVTTAGHRTAVVRLVGLGPLVFSVSVLVLDATYLFHDVGFRLIQWDSGRSSLADEVRKLGGYAATAWLLQVPVPVPLELLRGLDTQLVDTERLQESYLFGRTRLGGWWYWYGAVALIKIPLPALALLTLAVINLPRATRGHDSAVWAALCTLMPAVQMALAIAISTGTGTNAAFRYMLPSLALSCVWIGPGWWYGSGAIRCIATGLLVWLGLTSAACLPDHLGWENELGRLLSPDRPAVLGDSLDWGQDLARLGQWVRQHSSEGGTLVCVYSLGDSEAYGLRPPWALPTSSPGDGAAYLAVSADILFGYETQYCVDVAGGRSPLALEQREALNGRRPFDKVGRTIWIYRIKTHRAKPRPTSSGASRGDTRPPVRLLKSSTTATAFSAVPSPGTTLTTSRCSGSRAT
jgi:hypothetical protein